MQSSAQVTLGPLGLLETLLAHPEAFLGEWQRGKRGNPVLAARGGDPNGCV